MRDLSFFIPELLLRVAVALSFLYPPIDALFSPNDWIGYFPRFISTIPFDTHLFLHGFGLIEVGLAVWILSGRRVRIPALICAALLFAIVIFNMSQLQILFRDISIALAALALAFWPRRLPAA